MVDASNISIMSIIIVMCIVIVILSIIIITGISITIIIMSIIMIIIISTIIMIIIIIITVACKRARMPPGSADAAADRRAAQSMERSTPMPSSQYTNTNQHIP